MTLKSMMLGLVLVERVVAQVVGDVLAGGERVLGCRLCCCRRDFSCHV